MGPGVYSKGRTWWPASLCTGGGGGMASSSAVCWSSSAKGDSGGSVWRALSAPQHFSPASAQARKAVIME